MDKGLEKFEKGLISIGMPAFLLLVGLALALNMVSFLSFGFWSVIVGWLLTIGSGIGLILGFMKLPKMF